ncbi:MAG: phasin family protein [Burkholderiales bacterium]
MADVQEQLLEQWRKHSETGLRMMDAVVEATTHMREAQLAAAQETHERVQALQKALGAAKSAQEMWGEQWSWTLVSCERSAAYWRNLFETMTEANGKIARCMQEGAGAAGPLPFSGELPSTGFEVVDKAYRDMIKSSQQFLQSATSAFAPPAPQARKDAKQAA